MKMYFLYMVLILLSGINFGMSLAVLDPFRMVCWGLCAACWFFVMSLSLRRDLHE